MTRRITQAEFARQCGVNRSTVNRWVKHGRITLGADGLIDPEQAHRLRLATESPEPHHQARKVQFEEARSARATQLDVFDDTDPGSAADDDLAAGTDGMEALGIALKRHTVALQRNKAELAALDVDRQAGLLVERAAVDFVLDDLGATLRSLMETLPDRLAAELAQHQGNVTAIHATLEEAFRELLESLSGHLARRMEALPA